MTTDGQDYYSTGDEYDPTGDPTWEPAAEDQAEAQIKFNQRVAEEVLRLRVREAAVQHLRSANRPAIPNPAALSELLAEPDDPTRWRVHDILQAGGRVVLSAQRKSGKTTMVANLVRALADGSRFLGQFGTVRARHVTMLDFEMSRGQIRDWLRDVSVKATDRVTLWPLRGSAASFDLTDQATRRQWASALRDLGTDVLIVDCLRPILDAIGLSEDKEAGKFLVNLDALLAEAGISECVLVHHAGHSGERSRGDSRLRDWPDVEWRIVRESEDAGPGARRYFSAEGRDVSVPEGMLDFDRATRSLTLTGGSRKETAGDELVPAVLEIVNAPTPDGSEGWSLRSIQSALTSVGHQQTKVRAAIKSAVSHGLISTIPGPRGAHLHIPVQRVECVDLATRSLTQSSVSV